MSVNFTALLPMKGHSERIPNKNLKELGGKPLCFWVIEALQQVPAITSIVINTDSPMIAQRVQAHFDVVIHKRPEALEGDFVSMNRIIEYDLSQLSSDHTYFIQTHATNPFLSANTLQQAIEQFVRNLPTHDSLFSVTRHQARFYKADGTPVNHNPAELLRTQDLPPLYEENSNFYIFSRESFAKTQQRIGETSAIYEMEPLEAIDIDEPSDWQLAEFLAQQK